MIIVYVNFKQPNKSVTECLTFLDKKAIPYVIKNTKYLTATSVKAIITPCYTLDDILIRNCNSELRKTMNYENMKMDDLINYIVKKPNVLKNPIVIDNEKGIFFAGWKKDYQGLLSRKYVGE